MSSYFKGGGSKITCRKKMQKSNDRECCALKCIWHKYFLMKSLSNFTNILSNFSQIHLFPVKLNRILAKYEIILVKFHHISLCKSNPNKFYHANKRSIFQTFCKPTSCTKFLFIELETSNFGCLLIFWFSLTVQSFREIGQFLY